MAEDESWVACLDCGHTHRVRDREVAADGVTAVCPADGCSGRSFTPADDEGGR